ncbi:hypothetical protein RF11_01375 [Thelohanellus kitauei]|uniref:Integrase catalytic domain-containing protein n=1 Tax=Thelohanellus kitauei TaxID=669202 RepID=A0A0C2MWV1_THEKT|nr:hypothetical protein RF11_01375 [Thelohanellus kitauei]
MERSQQLQKFWKMKSFREFGLPNTIHSDPGHQYECVLSKQVCKESGINKSKTTEYHLQGNRAAARCVPKAAMGQNIKSCFFELRNLIHESPKYFAFEIIYGREPRLFADLLQSLHLDHKKSKRTFVTNL